MTKTCAKVLIFKQRHNFHIIVKIVQILCFEPVLDAIIHKKCVYYWENKGTFMLFHSGLKILLNIGCFASSYTTFFPHCEPHIT